MHRAQAKARRSTAHPSIYSDMALLPDQTRPFICTSFCAGASRAQLGGLTTRFLRGALLLSLRYGERHGWLLPGCRDTDWAEHARCWRPGRRRRFRRTRSDRSYFIWPVSRRRTGQSGRLPQWNPETWGQPGIHSNWAVGLTADRHTVVARETPKVKATVNNPADQRPGILQ